jgi:hypothetical protein
VNVWHKLFLFNHGLADKPASRAIAVLSAAGGVAMFLSPDDVTFRTPRGWLALAFSVLSAIVLAPLLLQWLIARIWRRYG